MKVQNNCFPYGIAGTNEPILFCFHHAGGNASTFRDWAGIHNDISFVPIEYGGHGSRFRETFDQSITEMTETFAKQIAEEAGGREIVVYGHSLGAIIAFETVAQLETMGIQVAGLIVAGRGAPFDSDYSTFRSNMGMDALIEEMRRIGGMEDYYLENNTFMRYYAPIVMNDYRLHETYQYNDKVIDAPITAHCGADDTDTSFEQMSHWKEVTNGRFDEQLFEGNHFFMFEKENYVELLTNIVNAYKI